MTLHEDIDKVLKDAFEMGKAPWGDTDFNNLHSGMRNRILALLKDSIKAAKPEKLGTSKEESDSEYFYGLGNDQALDEYEKAILEAIEGRNG